MINFIQRTLSTRVTPLAYIYGLQGLVYGASFAFFSQAPGVQNTILFKNGALVGIIIWGSIALISSSVLILGLISRNKFFTQLGSLGMFMCWVFAAITYANGGYFFLLLPLAFLNMLSYGYLYLASSIDTLWDFSR